MRPLLVKWLVLVMITLQTTALVLVMRHSRTSASGQHYLASTAVLLTEITKLIATATVLWAENGCSVWRTWDVVRREVVAKPRDTLRIAVPSFLYTIQNNLQYVALSNLDAATFQVLYQLKILTTALMSAVMLNRRVLPHQWAALLLLVAGVCIVQAPSATEVPALSATAPGGSRLLGIFAVLASSLSSGYSGVYFERVVKLASSPAASLAVRNLQLSLFSLCFGAAAVALNDGAAVAEGGFFQGYTRYTWAVIVLQAFGGLAVSVAMKYADNILKGFATSVSILLSAVLSVCWLRDTPLSWSLAGGAALVVTATCGYAYQPAPARRSQTHTD